MTNELPETNPNQIDPQQRCAQLFPDEIEEPHQTTIHEALAYAASSERTSGEVVIFSVRIPEDVKCLAQGICENNGTQLGAYLRECAKALLRDYGHAVDGDDQDDNEG